MLIACDPAPIDTELGASSYDGGTTDGDSSTGLGLFNLIYDDYDGGDLKNADIKVSSGDPDGSGTEASPLEYTLGIFYTHTAETIISEDSHLVWSLYSPESPDTELAFAVVPCDSSISNSCNNSKNFDCWFNPYFNCKSDGIAATEPADVSSLDNRNQIIEHFVDGWGGNWAEVDLTVGLQVKLCNGLIDDINKVSKDSTCDTATLGYLHFEQYVP